MGTGRWGTGVGCSQPTVPLRDGVTERHDSQGLCAADLLWGQSRHQHRQAEQLQHPGGTCSSGVAGDNLATLSWE